MYAVIPSCMSPVSSTWGKETGTDQIDRPELKVGHGTPDPFQVDRLPIVHIALGRIVAKDPVHQDLFFFFRPPSVGAVLATEEKGPFSDRRRHDAGADQTDDHANNAFHEKPSRWMSPRG
jgi:hypothetical protein